MQSNQIYFTSDTHYGHTNIIKHAHRPFKTVKEMDAALINNWNAKVGKNDHVFILGDFSFYPSDTSSRILDSLNGTKHLILGNHDKRLNESVLNKFASVDLFKTIKVEDEEQGLMQRIMLCHYAMRVWDQSHYGAWHLYGHSHGTLPELETSRSFDVGVDPNNYTPLSYAEVRERMLKKAWKAIDKHDGSRK